MGLSFTGPSRLSPVAEAGCLDILGGLQSNLVWRSGGAYGLDTLVAERAINCELVVPINQTYNEDLLTLPNIIRVRRIVGSYRARNIALVLGSIRLHAFLYSPTFYRSGEWMTVNIARRYGVPVTTHLINR